MATATEGKKNEVANSKPKSDVPAIRGPRLPYHPMVEERFGIDKASWKALVEAIFPNASCTESVILALSYCRARRLDPFKRNVHIVAIWDKQKQCMVDSIWPGIGELRTTAFRTGEYAGNDETVLGPMITKTVGSLEISFPEFAQKTVHRIVKGVKVAFVGPRVYWLETYANIKRGDDTPNEMWANRPVGQLDKCAEAASLRAAFPEECGGDYIPEEIHSRAATIDGKSTPVEAKKISSIDELTEKIGVKPAEVAEKSDATDYEELPPQESVDHLANLAPDLAKCETLANVNEIEEVYAKLPLSDSQQAELGGRCEERREAIRPTRGSRKS